MSKGQFYDSFLQFIRLNDQPVEFDEQQLRGLIEANYDADFLSEVYTQATPVGGENV